MPQNPVDHCGVLDQRNEPEPPATARARQDVTAEAPLHNCAQRKFDLGRVDDVATAPVSLPSASDSAGAAWDASGVWGTPSRLRHAACAPSTRNTRPD
jgi:hypothetical protein